MIVTHNVRHLKDFDRIYLFSDGKIIESGTYRHLMENSKEFLSLID